MTIRLILSTMAVVCSLPGAAGAQSEVCDVKSGPESFEFEHYTAEQRPQEAERFKHESDRVSRQGNRLRLKPSYFPAHRILRRRVASGPNRRCIMVVKRL